MPDQSDDVLEELCQSLYKGDWHSFLIDLESRRNGAQWNTLGYQQKKNIERDIERIKRRLEQ